MRLAGAALAALLPLLSATWAAASQTGVTPIQKVVEMLGGMLEKAKERKQAEMVEWSAFKTFCSNTELVKQTDIQEADTQKEALKADIEKHDQEVKRLETEVADHKTAIEGYTKDEVKATKDRKAEREEYSKTHADYSESTTAIQNAIGVLKKRAADIPQAASMLQVIQGYTQLSAASKRAIDSFLSLGEQTKEMALLSAPEANAYEFQSESIIKMLEELKDKFFDERTALEKKEMTSKQAYEMLMLDLRNSIAAADNEIDKKTQSKAENVAGSTESSTLFDEVKTSRDDDQEYLTGLITTCQQKSADFNTRQQLREEEIQALEKAMEIISGEAVSGAAAKHLPAMLQVRQSFSFAQLRSASSRPSNQQNAIAFLTAESQRLDSHVLSALAMQMTADPFTKIKKMISDLIEKLKAQEAEEADHKKWCDDELKTNEQTRKDKTTEVDSLTAAIDQLESRLAVLKKDLGLLSKEIAEINAAVAKASEIRAKEKDSNEATIVEAVNGQTAIAQATKILSDFYKKAGGNTALAQVNSKQEPPIFDSAFQGQQKENNNVLAFLEVIASDFARLETDTKKSESAGQSEHDEFMAESKKSKEAKEMEQKTKEKEQLEKTEELSNKNDDLESAQKQLEAAMDYFDKLKPSCLNVAQPYEERVQRREEEVAALKEALEILNGEGVPSGPDALYSSTQGGNLAVDYR